MGHWNRRVCRHLCGATLTGAVWISLVVAPVCARDSSIPGVLTEELPTLRCLGVRWAVAGDANRNAAISVQYRQQGEPRWLHGMDLLRVESSALRETRHPAEGETLFAGSILGLRENTAYEVRFALADPDGGGEKRTRVMTTWTTPRTSTNANRISVSPDSLRAALTVARPGDMFVLQPGVYEGPVVVPSGREGTPIVLAGPAEGDAILDGMGKEIAIAADRVRHVIIQGLTIRNAHWGISLNESSHVTVRRCNIENVQYGISAHRDGANQERIYIADNAIEGRIPWPRRKDAHGHRAIQIGGRGHVICYNRIHGFVDGIDLSPPGCSAVDVYGNDISVCADDGIEMDYSDGNTRCFENRLTDVFMGISLQPVYGGPVYVYRNAIVNVVVSAFKLHDSPSGVLLFHNTSVRVGQPMTIESRKTVSNCRSRNNLFVGTGGAYACEVLARMERCDFDYDGFAGPTDRFLKWNKLRYDTVRDARKAGLYRHAILMETERTFSAEFQLPDDPEKRHDPSCYDLRPAKGSKAVDKGEAIPNINDTFSGRRPDLGAYEYGQEMPQYGPRNE